MTYTGAYGTGTYGTGAWGGLPTDLELELVAYAVGDRLLRIELSMEPRHRSTTGPGDVLNPRSWRVLNQQTGIQWTILSVKQISETVYELITLESFPKYQQTLTVQTIGMMSHTGSPFPTASADFNGCYLNVSNTQDAQTAARGYYIQDLTNLPVPPMDVSVLDQAQGSLVGGTLQIDSGGNYTVEYGPALVKKLIMRRLIARPGDFFHLPDYGLGLREKETLPRVELKKLAAAIEEAVRQEPEVADVRANLSYSAAASALIIQLKVLLKATGQVMGVSLNLNPNAVQL